jgi:hypothetical protein
MEADSTDNNFFRTLGETGLVGFVTFYGIIFFLLKDVFWTIRAKNIQAAVFSIGFTASTCGLMITAMYLDVFAASKVAFVYWAVAGLILKYIQLQYTPAEQKENALRHFKNIKLHIIKHGRYMLCFFFSFILHQNPYMEHTPIKDIELETSGLEQLTRARCFIKDTSI